MHIKLPSFHTPTYNPPLNPDVPSIFHVVRIYSFRPFYEDVALKKALRLMLICNRYRDHEKELADGESALSKLEKEVAAKEAERREVCASYVLHVCCYHALQALEPFLCFCFSLKTSKFQA